MQYPKPLVFTRRHLYNVLSKLMGWEASMNTEEKE